MTQLVPNDPSPIPPLNPPPPPGGSSNTVVRWVVGCFVALLVLALVVGGLVWWFLIRPAQKLLGGLSNLSQLEELDKGVRNTSSYTPPGSGEISPEQLSRLLSVERAVKTQVGDQLGTLETRYKALDNGQGQVNAQNFEQALEGLGDLFKVLIDAKKAQVAALNTQNFSKNEYAWVRDQTFQALSQVTGQPFTGFRGLEGRTPQIYSPSVPPSANVEAVKPHQDELTESLPMHVFGL